ncbi:MAG: hypothetical protein IJ071_03035 [Ruminococcus sp.]|nr:hypothetical protein [Ruminococcus sp.]
MLTNDQLSAVRYYIGDVSGSDPFWSQPKAYLVLNSLLYPGISTEKARAAEGKLLDPELLSDTERLLGVYRELFSAFRESSAEKELITYRVERWSDHLISRSAGRTTSFTSTSTAGFLKDYRDRAGIALLRFVIPEGTPCLDMARVLPEYAKSQEAEVLLPPFMELSYKELPLTEEELQICDCNGQPPKGSFEVRCGAARLPELAGKSLPQEGADAGKRLYTALSSGSSPSPADASAYIRWKEQFQRILTE